MGVNNLCNAHSIKSKTVAANSFATFPITSAISLYPSNRELTDCSLCM
jgi:hypothetical protein